MGLKRGFYDISYHLHIIVKAFLVSACISVASQADTLLTSEHQITATPDHETRPALGSGAVIYTSEDVFTGANAKIFGSFLTTTGAPTGPRINVSDLNGFDTDDRLNDISGSTVLYTSTGFGVTRLVAYDLVTDLRTIILGDAGSVFDARIDGERIVFVQGGTSSTVVQYVEMSNPTNVVTLSGPAAAEAAIGSDFAVWTEFGTEVWAHRLSDGTTAQIAAAGSNPATAGDWVVYEGGTGLVAKQLGLGPSQGIAVTNTVDVTASANVISPRNPDIDDDLVAYEAVAAGGNNYDVYLYRLSDGAAFQVTNDGADQELNSIYGDKAAYGDYRAGLTADIWLSTLTFVVDPCEGLGGDADGDGICSANDNCPGTPNDQTDSDGDGIGNACDLCPFDAGNDADGDGTCGDIDNCPFTYNPTQGDVDGDGIGDACDFCPTDPGDDLDGDGVCGDVDNCNTVPNPDQVDSDSDGLGDACDVCALDPQNDIDGDGLCANVDPCPLDPTNACGVITGPLIGHYPFSGNPDDVSGNFLSGIVLGGAAYTTDREGNPDGAILLDGVDDYVQLPLEDFFDLTEFTIAATIKVPDHLKDNWLISKGADFGNFSLSFLNDQAPSPGYAMYSHQLAAGNWSTLASNAAVPTGEFFNIAVTMNSTEFNAYINGEPVRIVPNPPAPQLNDSPVLIGAGGYYGITDFFNGVIDELRIYNVALTARELRDLHDAAPVANAGADQTVHAGSLVTLDGSGSSDPDNHYPLTYAWTIVSKPTGSITLLSDPSIANPTFNADKIGDYTVELIVTDSIGKDSTADYILVSTTNIPPIADAGPDQAIIELDTLVMLDGSQSYDLEGHPLTFTWTLVEKPVTSGAWLSDPASATPTFIADVQGSYTAELIVNDGWADSAADSVTVSFDNIKPVADAGGNQAVLVGDTVILNGIGSSDANGDSLTYNWGFVSIPTGSSAVLSTSTSTASFMADAAGTYIASLTVNDGQVTSDADNATIVAITVQDELTNVLVGLINNINSLSPDLFKNKNMANTLTNKINAVISLITDKQYQDALDKLTNDILKKTDGCTNIGTPDKNDWILDCEIQAQVYGQILEAINLLKTLM